MASPTKHCGATSARADLPETIPPEGGPSGGLSDDLAELQHRAIGDGEARGPRPTRRESTHQAHGLQAKLDRSLRGLRLRFMVFSIPRVMSFGAAAPGFSTAPVTRWASVIAER